MLLDWDGRINGFNPIRKEPTTFQVDRGRSIYYGDLDSVFKWGGPIRQSLTCLRYDDQLEFITYFKPGTEDFDEQSGKEIITTDPVFMKIGQYPAAVEFYPDLRKYRSILPNNSLKELKRALGLKSHGIGIGSFVYLRRIFEKLLEIAHQEASQLPTFDKSKYGDSRVSEKINMLKDYLPDFLVENSKIYGILSTGIHELSEDDCLSHFDVVYNSIELILDEKIREKERKEKEEQAKMRVSKLAVNIKNSKK